MLGIVFRPNCGARDCLADLRPLLGLLGKLDFQSTDALHQYESVLHSGELHRSEFKRMVLITRNLYCGKFIHEQKQSNQHDFVKVKSSISYPKENKFEFKRVQQN